MKKNIVRTMVCMVLAIALFACGGRGTSDSGAPDTMTVTISGPSGTATTTYTEGSYNAQGHLDPYLYSYVTAINTTVIALQSGESYTQRTLINITINGNTPQSYPIDLLANNPIDIFYETNNGTYATIFSNPSGTITISSIGNVGEKITGSFDAIATHMSYTDTIRISGTFSVTRDN